VLENEATGQGKEELGTVSIAHRPCPLAKTLKFRHLRIFRSELFGYYPQCIEMNFVFKYARAYNKYKFKKRSNDPDFPKIHCIFYVKIKFSLWPHPCKVIKFPFLVKHVVSN
jgi:hypothetical protein